MPEHWYAARAKPSQERIALKYLAAQFFTTYWPQIEIERVKAGKVVRLNEPLFPGYLFIFCEMQVCSWRAINGTRGIQRLLSFAEDGRPSQVPDGEVESLQDREKKGQFKYSEIMRFRKGDLIKVKNGNCVGQLGNVLRTRGERVEFLMYLLGRRVRVIAPIHTLHLVSQAPVRKPLPA